MKKCSFITFILVFSIWITNGQTKQNLDSINLYLQTIKIDTVKVAELNEFAWRYRDNDSIGSAFAYEALKISTSINDVDGHSTSLMRLAVIKMYAGDYESAEKFSFKSLQLEEDRNNLRGIFRAKFQLVKINEKKGDYDTALIYAAQSLLITNTLNDYVEKAKMYSVLGTIYESKLDFGSAVIHHEESIKIREQLGEKIDLARSYLKLANALNSFKKYNEELINLQKGLKLCLISKNEFLLSKFYTNLGANYEIRQKKDSALIFYQKSLTIKEKNNYSGKDVVYANIGDIHQYKNLLNLAEEYYLKSLQIAVNSKNKKQEAITSYNLGNVYLKKGSYNKAIKSLTNSREIAKQRKDLSLELKILMSLAESHERKGNFQKASLYNEKHIVLRDSLDKIFNDAKMTIASYEREKRKNEKLEQEKEIDQQKIKTIKAEEQTQEIILYAVSGILILVSILFFAILRFRKERREKELIAQNNIELLKKQELKSIKAMIDGQEKERKRIAQNLHDRLGSMLSMVKLHYKSVEDNLDALKEKNKEQYEKANNLLDEACVAVREIAHEMISGVLTKFGLTAALEELKDTIEGSGTLKVELITFGLDNRLENKLEMEIYGIIQELIHNIIKHADAKELSIQLLKRDGKLNIIVEDDGVGFDISSKDQNVGMGLKSVYSRVDDLSGEIEIDSGRGNGSTITIHIPLDV